MSTERRVYRLFGICVSLLIASFIVPRFVSNPEAGFAAGASAVLTLLIMLGVTLILSLYLFVLTIQSYISLGKVARIAGISPAVVLAAMLFGLFGFLSY